MLANVCRLLLKLSRGIEAQALAGSGGSVPVELKLSTDLRTLHITVPGESRAIPLVDIDLVLEGHQAQAALKDRLPEEPPDGVLALKLKDRNCLALQLVEQDPKEFAMFLTCLADDARRSNSLIESNASVHASSHSTVSGCRGRGGPAHEDLEETRSLRRLEDPAAVVAKPFTWQPSYGQLSTATSRTLSPSPTTGCPYATTSRVFPPVINQVLYSQPGASPYTPAAGHCFSSSSVLHQVQMPGLKTSPWVQMPQPAASSTFSPGVPLHQPFVSSYHQHAASRSVSPQPLPHLTVQSPQASQGPLCPPAPIYAWQTAPGKTTPTMSDLSARWH